MNYEEKKLTDFNLVKIFVISTLCKWESLREIEEGFRSKKPMQRELELKSISYSQLSRRLINLNTADLADSDAVNHIIDEDALYVMDRGYAHKTKIGG
ncbi:hypothetical protein CSV71_05850 [Sporosarcina sp. P21c]|uniref:hypothetical protein n=1 Tax=unclassified Sporosarcina TaxID=2647733 RepID=UPI000C16318D|nr:MULTISPECIES: hypothetical protein [unclassified Sporosarcina]PIC67278.1 hypothetical protein CSV78_08065 [Sporosarcina sp. P16a]PIC90222.1 hypothetical protein CSV71_05850 [Sporosarcina sp. P21c]PIC92730.1 hypothetical protein CSV70_08815 [Sporosarcina sp. P25]